MNKFGSTKLRHKIFLLENRSRDISLEEDNWQVKDEFYAEIKPLSEQQIKQIDSIQFGHLILEEYFIFTCRYNNKIKNEMRLKFNNRIFTIKKIVNPYEKNKFLKLITNEIK